MRNINDDLHVVYSTLWCLMLFSCDIPNVVWSSYWLLDYTSAWFLMIIANETTLFTLTVICKDSTTIDEYMVQNSQGGISKWGCPTHKNDTQIMLPAYLNFSIGASYCNVVVMMHVYQLTLASIAPALYELALLFSEALIVAADDKIKAGRGKVVVDASITLNLLSYGSYGYWTSQEETFGFPDDMLCASMKSTPHLINADSSNVVVHAKATWLHSENTWFNFLLATILKA